MKRPKITVRGPDARYPNEKTAEFIFSDGSGGLLTLRMLDGVPVVEMHGLDGKVKVRVYEEHLYEEPSTGAVLRRGQYPARDE